MEKYAVISIDVEDWNHLDYFSSDSKRHYSMLDGLNNFLEIVDDKNIKTTLFTLSDVIPDVRSDLFDAIKAGHEIASHGKSHIRPLTQEREDFINETYFSKEKIEQELSTEVIGYRAPCFSMNNDLLEVIHNAGFKYDSSMIEFSDHPLYGGIQKKDFDCITSNIYRDNNLFEFELPTLKVLNKNIPISGGGYLRIFPWLLMKKLLQKYFLSSDTYFLYIHPFELSKKQIFQVEGESYLKNLRFRTGHKRTSEKFKKLLNLLEINGYKFINFNDLVKLHSL